MEKPARYQEVLGDLRTFYDRTAAERDGFLKSDWKVAERAHFLSYFQREEKRSSLLEIGAGTGQDAQFFQENGLEVVCTDLSPEMVKRCREKGLAAHVMDFLHLDFPPESFDAVYALNCLLHVPKADLPAVLTTIRALLRPGGLFYMGVYGGEDKEGVWENDRQKPNRFFSYHSDESIQKTVAAIFDLLYFKSIPLGISDFSARECFQSLILRRSQ